MDTLVALLAAVAGAFGALGMVWLQNWNQSRSTNSDARESAYVDLLVSSMAFGTPSPFTNYDTQANGDHDLPAAREDIQLSCIESFLRPRSF